MSDCTKPSSWKHSLVSILRVHWNKWQWQKKGKCIHNTYIFFTFMVSVCKFAAHSFRLLCSALSRLRFLGCHLHFISTPLLVFINVYDCLFVLMHKQTSWILTSSVLNSGLRYCVPVLFWRFCHMCVLCLVTPPTHTHPLPPPHLLPPTLITLISNTCSSFTCPSICPRALGLGSFYKRSS